MSHRRVFCFGNGAVSNITLCVAVPDGVSIASAIGGFITTLNEESPTDASKYDNHSSTATLLLSLLITLIILTFLGVVGLLLLLFYRKKYAARSDGASISSTEDGGSSASMEMQDIPVAFAEEAWANAAEVLSAAAIDTDTDSEMMDTNIVLEDLIVANLTSHERAVINSMTPVVRSAWLMRQRRLLSQSVSGFTASDMEEMFLRGFPQAEPLQVDTPLPRVVDAYVVIPQDRVDEYLARMRYSTQRAAPNDHVSGEVSLLPVGPEMLRWGAAVTSTTSHASGAAAPNPRSPITGTGNGDIAVDWTASGAASAVGPASGEGTPRLLQVVGSEHGATGETLGVLQRVNPL